MGHIKSWFGHGFWFIYEEVKGVSKTTSALLVKFLLTLAAAAVPFIFFSDNPWGTVTMLAVLGTALNYLIGDLAILPTFGNVVAAISDGLLAAITAFIYGRITPGFRTTMETLVTFAILVMVAEYFFHQYLIRSEKVAP